MDISVDRACSERAPLPCSQEQERGGQAPTDCTAAEEQPPPARRGCDRAALRRPIRRRPAPRLLIPLAVLGTFAVLFVGWEVLERHLFPTMSVGLRHALLTIRAGVVTVVASGIVYLLMRQHQQRLADTAQQLTSLLKSWQDAPAEAGCFENPHFVHCREVLDCDCTECPMYDSPGERCWQVMALGRAAYEQVPTAVEIEKCRQCEVYRRSCPDKLTELGESFNNLIFMLEGEAKQLRRMQVQMVEKEKMVAIGQMAAGIAHEVRNPLSSISSVVQMLRRGRSHASKTDQFDLIEQHIQRISATVRQLASLARPVGERWERVDIGKTLAEAVELIGFDRRARNVEIDFQPPESLPPTFALPSQLQQVFINLALNALDAMPEGGRLTVRAQSRRGELVVTIEDTGCGIPPATGRRVFEPFVSTKEPGRGTGLGLAVSYGIVQKHGGTIDFQSTVGQGTLFTVSLPVFNRPPGAENGTDHSTTRR